MSSKNLYSNNPSNISVRGNKGGWDNSISGIVWEQTFQINNSYNKFITCNSSIFYHQIFHIKKYLYIVSHHNIYIYIYIYQYHHINNFLSFSRSQRLRPVNRVVLSPFRIRTSFSSIFLRKAPLEPKGALPC